MGRKSVYSAVNENLARTPPLSHAHSQSKGIRKNEKLDPWLMSFGLSRSNGSIFCVYAILERCSKVLLREVFVYKQKNKKEEREEDKEATRLLQTASHIKNAIPICWLEFISQQHKSGDILSLSFHFTHNLLKSTFGCCRSFFFCNWVTLNCPLTFLNKVCVNSFSDSRNGLIA